MPTCEQSRKLFVYLQLDSALRSFQKTSWVNELAFAISSCLRNVEYFNRQVAFATQKKDEVSARAIAWANLSCVAGNFHGLGEDNVSSRFFFTKDIHV